MNQMRHFVQYHNAEKMGDYPALHQRLGIVTNKVKGALPSPGDRIWLITGKGRPRRYSLCSWFNVSEIVSKPIGPFNTRVNGKHGENLESFVSLDSRPWFSNFKRRCGNFGLGLMPVDDDAIISDFEAMI